MGNTTTDMGGRQKQSTNQAGSTGQEMESKVANLVEEGDGSVALREHVDLICGMSTKKGWPPLFLF